MSTSLSESRSEVKPQVKSFTKKCDKCHGVGLISDYFDMPETCTDCEGVGKIILYQYRRAS